MRPLFRALANTHRVYAFDLPGFGCSDRGKRDYTPALYVDAVRDMIDQIEAQSGPEPIDLVALSLGAEFAASAALEAPERIHTVAMISPTGLDPWHSMRYRAGLHGALSFPIWSQAAYDLLVTEPSIRYFLRKVWGRDDVDEELVEYAYRTSHQRDARHAPFAFLSGVLFTREIERTYRGLPCPVWVAHGTRGEFALTEEQLGPVPSNWAVHAFETGAMPHFESPDTFYGAYRGFLDSVVAPTVEPSVARS
jgi:pimeloyl-ACP methyl ester carboxylesterase